MGRSEKPKNAETGYRDLFVETGPGQQAHADQNQWPPIDDFMTQEQIDLRWAELTKIEKSWFGDSKPAAAQLIYDLQKSHQAVLQYAAFLDMRRLYALKVISHAQRQPSFSDARVKSWVIDQVTHIIAGGAYSDVVARAQQGANGPATYEWDKGLATNALEEFVSKLHERFAARKAPSSSEEEEEEEEEEDRT